MYVVRCADNSLYTGISPDVAARLAKHDVGKGARYLKGRGPLELAGQTVIGDRALASKVEWAFKRQTKRQKEICLGRPRGLDQFVADLVTKL